MVFIVCTIVTACVTLCQIGSTKIGWNARVTRLGQDSLLATLNLPSATSDFTGNYTCGPPSLQLASVTLHVLHGIERTESAPKTLNDHSEANVSLHV